MTDTVVIPAWASAYTNWQREWRERAGLRTIEPASAELVSVAEAAAHLRLDAYGSPPAYEDETLIGYLITAAREYVEGLTGLTLAPATLELRGRSFPGLCRWEGDSGIELRTAPVSGIVSVSYVDGDGATQAMSTSDYVLDADALVPVLFPAYGASWPGVRDEPGAVRIRFTAGYDAGGSPSVDLLPRSLRAALLLMVGHLYENREETTRGEGGSTLVNPIPLGISALIERYRVRRGFA